jgi:hypothetical protein
MISDFQTFCCAQGGKGPAAELQLSTSVIGIQTTVRF